MGYSSLVSDECVLTNKLRDVYIIIFVDNVQFTGPNASAIEALIILLSKKYKITDLGNACTYLGI